MKYRVIVAMMCEYLVEAESAEQAEELSARLTPSEADSISIVDTTAVEASNG